MGNGGHVTLLRVENNPLITHKEGGLVLHTNKLCNGTSSPQFIKLFPSGSLKLLILLSSPHVLALINNYKHPNALVFYFNSYFCLAVELI